jgi:hypothetical protein
MVRGLGHAGLVVGHLPKRRFRHLLPILRCRCGAYHQRCSSSVLNLVLQNHTDWELTKQFVIEQLQVALLTDSQKAVLPLSVADGVVNNFDDVSYNKGGSIFRMVHYILGLENFQKGLTDYMSAQYVDFERTRGE